MILSRDDFFRRLSEQIGDRNDEESIAFVEDMTETYDDLERRAEDGGADWRKKYEENDASWRERYKSRFFNGKSSGYQRTETTEIDENGNINESITINELFANKKKNVEE